MKKLLWIMLAWIFGIALSAGTASAASSDCLNVRFGNWDSVCLGIEKSWSKNFKISIDENNLERNASLRCYVVLPNSYMYSIDGCKWNFSYAGTNTDDVAISATYVTRNSNFYSKRIVTRINFNKWTRGGSSSNASSSSSSSSNSDEVKLSTNRTSPSTSQYVNLTIKTDKKYTGKLTLSAKYRSSSSSSWSNISNTSSTYFSNYSDEWDDGYYKMRSSDNGNITLNNLVKFKKNGYYRIYVKDTDGNESYIQFNVWVSSSSSSSNDDLKVSASSSNPDTYEWVKLSISTDDDYTGKINFSRFQYRSSSSSSWSNISRTSSTYVSDYSNEWSNGYYKMTSSDDGEATLKNLIKFKKSWYYRIYVEDTDGNESYVQINVDTSSSSSSSSSNNEIELSTNRKSPSTSQYVNLTIETDDDYVGRLTLSAKYRSSSSNSWTNISNTSSNYFSDYSDEWENGFYRMVSSDDGEVTLGDLVKFRKAGYYRIYVKDYDDNENYIEFNVDTAGSSDDNTELKVTASPSNPDTYDWINLTVKTDADYDARIKISKLQYRSSSSSSWSNISNITSSTYVSDYSDVWSNSYRRIVTDEDGKATLKNIVKFKKSWYYRIYIEDTDDNESYVQINVDTSSSSSSSNSNDEIELSTNRKSPSTSQYVNLTIETDKKYTGKLNLSVKYRKSSSDSWSSISNTSSTYFSDYSDEWDDGYYKMRSSDNGEITLKNLVKFRKNGYYRIYVEDTDDNESYIQFNVGEDDDDDESNVSWFSSSEMSKVKDTYKEWNSMIWQMERRYPSLKRDSYWVKLSENFYDDMKDIINNKKSRDLEDFDDFQDAFDDWYKYTMRNI